MSDQSLTIQYIPIDKLRLDPQNPRLPTSVNGRDELAVIASMLRDATIIELMGSIGEQGYFAGEPLLVCSNGEEHGTYWVIEGNRRFTAVKLLTDPELAPNNKNSVRNASDEAKHKPLELPVVIYPNRDAILNYLSYRHITGVKAWSSLAKARYLSQLRLLHEVKSLPINEQFKHLAKTIGTRADYVARILTGYSVYNSIVNNDFFRIDKLNEESMEFSILTTSLTYSHIPNFLGLTINDDPNVPGLRVDRLEELTRWMFEENNQRKTRLGESRNLKYLNSVVANEKALAAFREGMPLLYAKDLTEAPTEIFRNAIIQAKSRLEIARDNLHHVEKPTNTDNENLKDIGLISRNMRIIISAKLMEAEEDLK